MPDYSFPWPVTRRDAIELAEVTFRQMEHWGRSGLLGEWPSEPTPTTFVSFPVVLKMALIRNLTDFGVSLTSIKVLLSECGETARIGVLSDGTAAIIEDDSLARPTWVLDVKDLVVFLYGRWPRPDDAA